MHTSRYLLRIPCQLYEAMLSQARAELPNECCGLLAGRIIDGVGVVSQHFPLVNVAEQPRIEYFSDPRAMLAASKAMRFAGIDALAVYHSHPTSEPMPSRKDCAQDHWAIMNLIISLATGQPRVRAWWLSVNDYWEGKWEIAENK